MQTHHSFQNGDSGCRVNKTEHARHVELILNWQGPMDSGSESTHAEKVRRICTVHPNKPTIIRTPTGRVRVIEKDGKFRCCRLKSKRSYRSLHRKSSA